MDIKGRLRGAAYRIGTPRLLLKTLSDPVDALTRLANRHGSDKGDAHLSRHAYTRVYGPLFAPLRDRPVRVLEIGLLHLRASGGWADPARRNAGGQRAGDAPSLRMWADYFPRAEIFGFDLNDFSGIEVPRTSIVQGDMGDPDDLARLVRETGGRFDVVIEDASHASHHQQIALAHLFPHVAPGGLYAIEDLRFQPPALERPDAEPTRAVLRRGGACGDWRSSYIDDAAAARLAEQVASVEFYDSLAPDAPLTRNDSLAVLRKRPAPR